MESAPPPVGVRHSVTWRVVRALGAVLRHTALGLMIAWGAGALYFSELPWTWARYPLALGFAAFGIWALWFSRRTYAIAGFAVLFLALLAWWTSILPSHDREWRAEVAVMPRAHVEGDHVQITGVRNFDYVSERDFTPHYETREVELSHLIGVDFYISYWMPGPIGHTFLSFVFDNAPPVSVSIEARPESHEGFSPLGSLFKQFELIYVVGDERDITRVRTNYRGEEVYLYRVASSPEHARALFLVYLARMNALAERPEHYNLLSNNCTINIVRYTRAAGRPLAFDVRHYLNGLADRYLYDLGLLDAAMPFETLRRRSNVNEAAQAAGADPAFSERIRDALPTQRNP